MKKEKIKVVIKIKLKDITKEAIKKADDKELLSFQKYVDILFRNTNNLAQDIAKKTTEELTSVNRSITEELIFRKMIDITTKGESFNKEQTGDSKQLFDFDYYDTFRKLYPWQIDDAGRIVSLLHEYGCRTVLDVGCGVGWLLALLEGWFEPTGIDRSEYAVKGAKRQHFNVYQGYGEELPFVDGMFDAVITNHVLENAPDPNRIVRECARVSKRLSVHIVPLGERKTPMHINEFITLDEYKVFGNDTIYPTKFIQTPFNNAIMVVSKTEHPIGIMSDYSKIILVHDYVTQIGDSVKTGTLDKGFDINIKNDVKNPDIENSFIEKVKGEFKDKIKINYNLAGSNGVCLPLYDLALVPRDDLMMPVNLEKAAESFLIQFDLPKPCATYKLFDINDYAQMWDDWCEDRKMVIVEQKYKGIRGVIEKDKKGEVTIFFDGDKVDRAIQFPMLVEQIKEIETPVAFECNFGLIDSGNVRMGEPFISYLMAITNTVNEEFDYIKGIKLKLRVIILDVIFYGEQVTTLPFSDRIKIINSININKFNLLQIPVSINVRTQSEFVVIVNDLINDKNSSGVIVKDPSSMYTGFDGECIGWIEGKSVARINTRIVKRYNTDTERIYTYKHEYKINDGYYSLGETEMTNILLEKGDIAEVQVEEIISSLTDKNMEVSVVGSVVLGKNLGEADTVEEIMQKGSKANILKCSLDASDVMSVKQFSDTNNNHHQTFGKAHSNNKCMECSEVPVYEVLWAEGIGHAWFCKKHFVEWANGNKVHDGGWNDIDSVKEIKNGKASSKFGDNTSPNILAEVKKKFKNKTK